MSVSVDALIEYSHYLSVCIYDNIIGQYTYLFMKGGLGWVMVFREEIG